jgi:NADH:ubiquinone oxidoreductase subunit H
MAGWSSSNKYAMLGSLRSAASMISYELSLGAAFVVPVLIAGSLSVGEIVESQNENWIFSWNIFRNPLAAGIMFIALLAEVNRADAEKLGVNEGDEIHLVFGDNRVTVTAKVDGRAPQGAVLVPMQVSTYPIPTAPTPVTVEK